MVSVNAVEATLPKKIIVPANNLHSTCQSLHVTHSLKREDKCRESGMFHILSYETAVSLAGYTSKFSNLTNRFFLLFVSTLLCKSKLFRVCLKLYCSVI